MTQLEELKVVMDRARKGAREVGMLEAFTKVGDIMLKLLPEYPGSEQFAHHVHQKIGQLAEEIK
jgi:hypothetical protein